VAIPPIDPRRRDLRRHHAWRRARATRRRRLAEAAATLAVVVVAILGVPLLLAPGSGAGGGSGAEQVRATGVSAGAEAPDRPGAAAGSPRPASRSTTRDADPATPPADADAAPSRSAAPSSASDGSAPGTGSSSSPSSAPSAPPVSPTTAAAPAPSPAPQAPPVPEADTALADEIVALTNAARRDAGLPELAVSPCATEQAVHRASVLVAEDRFEHDPLDEIVDACDVGTVGENLALGYPSAQAVVDGWLASPGHRANLLQRLFTSIGVGCVPSDRGPLCAQVFLG